MKKAKFLPYIVGVVIFYLLSYSFFSPLLEGKEIKGSDDLNSTAQARAIFEYHEKYGNWPKWTDAVFSGMPASFIFAPNPGNIFETIKDFLHKAFGAYPAVPLIVMMLGFFFLLLVLKVNPWLSIVGAVGYGFTTFFFILIPTGHYTQTFAFAYMAPLIASVIIAYQYNRWVGAGLVAVFASFELSSSHPQMAYYLVLILSVFVIVYFVKSIKEHTWKKFLITTAIVLVSGILALGTHMNALYPQYKFQKNTIRSASELTSNANVQQEGQTKVGSGLDYDYATSWSYGIDETLNILIPNLKGGGGSEYWGDQPFTSGPMYIGAVLLFLFVLSMFLLSGPIRWWLLIATALSVLLCWGHNSVVFDFFFNYVPLFNKFRNPAWALIIAMFTIPLGATLALQKIIDIVSLNAKAKKQVLYSAAIVGGICLLFWLIPGLAGNFEKQYKGKNGQVVSEQIVNAQQYARQTGQPFNQQLISSFEKVQEDLVIKRKDALKNDAIRSFLLISVAFLLIYFFISKKGFQKEYFIILIGVVILFDLWGINKRFVDNSNFSRKKKELIQPFQVNKLISQTEKGNRDFKVLDLTTPLDQDVHSVYFHRSLGGNSAAKLRRYQELIDYRLGKEFNALRADLQQYDSLLAFSPVLNMLNTKYIIYNNDAPPIPNRYALGEGWFVKNVVWAKNADEEIEALNNFKPAETVVINSKFKDGIRFNSGLDVSGAGSIMISSYKMDHIVYNATTAGNSFAVFSEIYYPEWHAFIDGAEVPIYQCNYVLRGIEVPKGKHTIEFKYIASEYAIGSTMAYMSSFVILGLILGILGFSYYKKRKPVLKA